MNVRTPWVALIVAAAMSGAGHAGDEAVRSEPEPEIEGHWEGSIELPGAKLGVRVDLTLDGETWSGTIDIPAQGASGLPLSGIRVTGSEVVFAIAGVPGEPTFKGELAEGAISGTFTQGGQRFPFRLGREKIEGPARPQEPKPPFPYGEEQVSFESEGASLAGTLSIPGGEAPFPAVLLISGSGPQNRDGEVFGHRPFLVLADDLARAGVAVLRVDDRGVGGSTGDRGRATSEDFAADAIAGVAFLAARPEIDPERIGLIGHSEGGIVAPMAATRSDKVAFIVLLAGPGVPGDEILERQLELISRAGGMPAERVARVAAAQRALLELVESGAQQDAIRARVRDLTLAQLGTESVDDTVEQAISREAAKLMTPWFRFFLTHDPRPVLREVRVPVLALYGEKDLQVDPRQNLPEVRKALEQGGNPDFTVEELPGLNHLFQKANTGSPSEYHSIEETIDPVALDAIREWIVERFAGPRTESQPALE